MTPTLPGKRGVFASPWAQVDLAPLRSNDDRAYPSVLIPVHQARRWTRPASSRGGIESREPIHSAKWRARRHWRLSHPLGPDMLMKGEPANMR